jgi:hypothetical protein
MVTGWSRDAGKWFLVALCCTAILADQLEAQRSNYGSRLGQSRGGEVSYDPVGPGVLFDALDPAVRRWYVPQELYNFYEWKQWEYTNYARNQYERYVSTFIEGDYFYDLYGSFISRGWLIYDWRQQQPQQFGSVIFKDPKFNAWFNQVIISSDHKGQHHLTLTIGSRIRTTLTPMTFSKPAFDGVQADYQSDKYAMTLLASRINAPGFATQIPVETTNTTNLYGFHGRGQLGDFITLGGTYINAHNSLTLLEGFEGNPLSGSLTVGQNLEHINRLFIRLSDDSPEDREGGATLFSWDIIIEAESDTLGENAQGEQVVGRKREVVRGSEIGFEPIVEGGFKGQGFLAADGSERIDMTYDFSAGTYSGPAPSTIRRVLVELVVANDYHIEMSSDRQTNLLSTPQPVFLTMERAADNVQDGSNVQVVRLDYGLPTGNDIIGFNLELRDVKGFDLYAEFDRSRLYRKYPNRTFNTHRTSTQKANAWMVNLARKGYPFFFFGEAYSMDRDYGTTSVIANLAGDIDYEDERRYAYEWVEDNDDQDRTPDWQRLNQGGPDLEIFPGWDENNDFISDFNQNDNEFRPNFIPDYEEPFLRYNVDRPEFLFGMDMNNNFWIDRFENDEEPDYPYDRDQRGFNAYTGAHITPEMRLTVGYKRARTLSADQIDRSAYGLLTWDLDMGGVGQLRLFELFKLVEDEIPDNLVQWAQPLGSQGTLQRIPDPLAAPQTWINSTFLGFDYTGTPQLKLVNKLKYEIWHQRQRHLDFRRNYQFFGLINKAEYRHPVRQIEVIPKVKNELRLEAPLLRNDPVRKENTFIFFLIARMGLLTKSDVQVGLEYTIFSQIEDPAPVGLREDFRETILALQYSNTGDYLGYRLTNQIGLRNSRLNRKGEDTFTGMTLFITTYAALE